MAERSFTQLGIDQHLYRYWGATALKNPAPLESGFFSGYLIELEAYIYYTPNFANCKNINFATYCGHSLPVSRPTATTDIRRLDT
jgi:hypothetical protein